MWDWVKQSGRHAIESTSRLLKKLELPELTIEQHDEHSRSGPDPGRGGSGYDPYNQAKQPRKPGTK